MAQPLKNIQSLLEKMNITALNTMQDSAYSAIQENKEVVILSPTGTGKTLAFILPLLERLDRNEKNVQALILVPSRELALQIETVIRDMGTGFKTNAVFGGRSGNKDRIVLQHPPAILVGTPGRVADHIRNETIITDSIKTFILDEFDKSLEIGFREEMEEIVGQLKAVEKKILTSATQKTKIPEFLGLENPKTLNFIGQNNTKLLIKIVEAPTKDKLSGLGKLLHHLGDKRGIIFCNFKESIGEVSNYLEDRDLTHSIFYGGLEQQDRERALIKFRNGSSKLLLATDLAARGIDVPELDYIIHFQLPNREDEFIHRNGRTARMNANGTAYILKWTKEELPPFISEAKLFTPNTKSESKAVHWTTLHISGGRKDKISKGDIAGLFFKQGKLGKEELGTIELQQDCSFVAIPEYKVNTTIALLNNSRLKKKKVRISRVD